MPINLLIFLLFLSNLNLSTGVASWYDYSLPNYPDYSKTHFTSASKDYPKGTYLLVCEKKCVIVRVNDYGPARDDRVIDLSSAAFKELSPLSKGVIKVKIYEVRLEK